MKDSSSSSIRLGGAVISDRIVSALLEELRTGRYADADRLPAEVDLAAQLSVSRTVIRDALSEMERAGYIERVRGIGTVVNRTVLNLRSRLDQKLEYYPLIRSFGSYPHADPFGWSPGDGVHHDHRVAQDVELHADAAEFPVETLLHALHLLGADVGRVGVQLFEHARDGALDDGFHLHLVPAVWGHYPGKYRGRP